MAHLIPGHHKPTSQPVSQNAPNSVMRGTCVTNTRHKPVPVSRTGRQGARLSLGSGLKADPKHVWMGNRRAPTKVKNAHPKHVWMGDGLGWGWMGCAGSRDYHMWSARMTAQSSISPGCTFGHQRPQGSWNRAGIGPRGCRRALGGERNVSRGQPTRKRHLSVVFPARLDSRSSCRVALPRLAPSSAPRRATTSVEAWNTWAVVEGRHQPAACCT